MDFSADYTRRLKVKYTSLSQPHQAIWRIANTTNVATFIDTVGAAFKATIHNGDAVIGYELAAQGTGVFLPVSSPPSGVGAGGRSGFPPTTTGLALATQRTLSGRTINGGRWKFVSFNSLDAEYDDFVINVDELDAADQDYIVALLDAGDAGDLVGNDGSSVVTIYPRMTVAINDHYVALYRRTRAG